MSEDSPKCWACDRPIGETLDLTNDEMDALYEHLMRTEQEADAHLTQHLDSILNKLPEYDILTRDPPSELRAELRLRTDRSLDTDSAQEVEE